MISLFRRMPGRSAPGWTASDRRAALRELEERCGRHLTEAEIFRAAALFFALLAEHAFVDRADLVQRVQRELVARNLTPASGS